MSDNSHLLAGFGEVDITPVSPENAPDAFKVFDPIGFRAIVLRCGEENLALLTGDFFSFENHMMEMVRAELADIEWLEPKNILASVSHCGGVPILYPSYVNQPCEHLRAFGQEPRFAAAAAAAIRAAIADLRPANMGIGQAIGPDLNYNRRSYDRDGALVMSNFLLPYPRPELTYGPIDPNVYVLRIDEVGQTPQIRAAAIVFGCHALCNNDKQGHISADYPGVARRMVQDSWHVPVAFAPGSIGNAVPMGRGGEAYRVIGEGVGAAAIRALEGTETCTGDFEVRRATVRVPRLAGSGMEEAAAAVATIPAAQDGNARFNVYSAKNLADSAQMDYTLTAVRIGDALLLHLPGEVFVETAVAIRGGVEARPLVILSGPTADVGYLCPSRAHQEGGMEPKFAALAGEAEAIIREAAIELATGIMRSENLAQLAAL